MNIFIKILKDIAILGVFITVLTLLGNYIDSLIYQYSLFGWLEAMFSMLKFFANSISFMWDTETMWQIIGYIISIEVAYWVFLAGFSIVKFFKSI